MRAYPSGHWTIEPRSWPTCALGLLLSILSSFVVVVFAGSSKAAPTGSTIAAATNVEEIPASKSKRNHAKRIKVAAGKSVEVVPGNLIVSAAVVDSKIATAEITRGRIVLIRGLIAGKTTLVVVEKTRRITYGIDVEPQTRVKETKRPEKKTAERPDITSGSHSFFFTPGFNGSPSFLRHAFDYSSKFQPGRTLRMSGDFFKIFDMGKRGLPIPPGRRFGPNRITFGIDTATGRLDLLDSQLDISQMGLTGYALRGLHLTSTRESRLHGLEIFAGTARPQVSFFKRGEGRIAGAIAPIVQSKSLRIRAAALLIAPNHQLVGSANPNSSPVGSPVVQTDLRYVPNDKTNIEAEVAHTRGGFSWRTKVDLHRGPFNVYGEMARLDETSPLIVIGAQSGGRQGSLLNGQWRPNSRFTAAVSYSRNTILPPTRIKRLQFDSALFLATISFAPIKSARLGFILNNYVSDSPAPPQLPFLLKMQTNSLTVKYDQTVSKKWANEVEAQIILNGERRTEAQLGRGFSIREQLRYASKRGSIAGLGSYRSNTPSFESLVLQNPAVLPVEFREVFGSDPGAFFFRNRKALPLLLSGLNRPLTQNWDLGLRMQRTISRLNLSGDAGFTTNKFMAFSQRTLLGSVNAQITLDPANSLQFTGSRLVTLGESRSQTALSIGYVYRFGAGSGGGFQFSRLLGRSN